MAFSQYLTPHSVPEELHFSWEAGVRQTPVLSPGKQTCGRHTPSLHPLPSGQGTSSPHESPNVPHSRVENGLPQTTSPGSHVTTSESKLMYVSGSGLLGPPESFHAMPEPSFPLEPDFLESEQPLRTSSKIRNVGTVMLFTDVLG